MAARWLYLANEAGAIYDVLVECCGAPAEEKQLFITYLITKCRGGHEWRFCGWLGFGGKLYANVQGVYVDAYSVHKTPIVKFVIGVANDRINAVLAAPEQKSEVQR